MPAFWEYPLPPHDYQYCRFISAPKSKEDTVKVTNLKNFRIFQKTRFCPQMDGQGETTILAFQLCWSGGIYHQTSNISHTLVGNTIVCAAPTTSSFSTERLASMDWAKVSAVQDEMKNMWVCGFGVLYIRDLKVKRKAAISNSPCVRGWRWSMTSAVGSAEEPPIMLITWTSIPSSVTLVETQPAPTSNRS